MNLILLFPDDFLAGTSRVRLSGRRQKHVLEVHRAKEGETLCVGLLNGRIGSGTIVTLNQDMLEMEVLWAASPPPSVPITLILALPRPSMLRRLFLTVTSFGLKKIYLINSFRVEKTFWGSHALREGDIREQLILGLEQAKDTVLPEIHLRQKFKPFVEDELPGIIQGTQPILADPEATELCPSAVRSAITLAVGPEGGFTSFEVGKFLELGFHPVHLGARILRVETAVPAFLGRLIEG